MEGRQVGVDRHVRTAQPLMADNQRQRDAIFVDIAGKQVQQHKQLLIERGKMVFATARLVGGQRRHRSIHKAVQQLTSGARFRFVANKQDDHQCDESTDHLPQHVVDEHAQVEGHRIIQNQHVDGTGQRTERAQLTTLYQDAANEAEQTDGDAEQQHALLGAGQQVHKIERAKRHRKNHTVEEILRHHQRIRHAHRQRGDHRQHYHTAAAGGPAGIEPEQRAEGRGDKGADTVNHRVMGFSRARLDNDFALENALFQRRDAAVAFNPFQQQQIFCRRADPARQRHGRLALFTGANHPPHHLHAPMHVGNAFCLLLYQQTILRRNIFRARILNEEGFRRLGNHGQRQRVEHLQPAVGVLPARRLHHQLAAHGAERRGTAHQRAPRLVDLLFIFMRHAELQQAIMRHQQRIDFAVDDLFNRARREDHIRQNGAENAEHNLAATFNRKLRHQRQAIVGVGGHHDNQRGIARQPQRIGVFNFD